jgi:DNA-binding NarL/FixJ family response regulator
MEKSSNNELKRTKVKNLGPEEYEIYIWLREAYSLPWIGETLLLAKRDVKRRAKQVYKSLGVKNRDELILQYGVLDKLRSSGFWDFGVKPEDLCHALDLYHEQHVI